MDITTVSARQVTAPPRSPGGGPAVDLRGVAVVGVEGDIDLHTGPHLRQALMDLLTPGGQGRGGSGAPPADERSGEEGGLAWPVQAVVVDMTAVDFIDSYAVGVLVQGHHLARRSGRGYALVATHPMIHKLFEITRLASVMPLHPDVASAVASLPTTSRSTTVR